MKSLLKRATATAVGVAGWHGRLFATSLWKVESDEAFVELVSCTRRGEGGAEGVNLYKSYAVKAITEQQKKKSREGKRQRERERDCCHITLLQIKASKEIEK